MSKSRKRRGLSPLRESGLPEIANPFKRPRKERAEAGQDSIDLSGRYIPHLPDLSTFTNLHKVDVSRTNVTALDFLLPIAKTLTLLNVSNCTIEDWSGLAALTQLRVLNASACRLRRQLPSGFTTLHELQAIVLADNELTSVDSLDSLPQLNTIVLSRNQISRLPALPRASKLKKISAAHNRLCTSDSLAFPDYSHLIALQEVRLGDNEGIEALPMVMSEWGRGRLQTKQGFSSNLDHSEEKARENKRSRGLAIIDLANTKIGEISHLQALCHQSSLSNLNLRGCPITEIKEYRQKVLEILPSLHILDTVRHDPLYLRKKLQLANDGTTKARSKGKLGKDLPREKGRRDGQPKRLQQPTHPRVDPSQRTRREAKSRSPKMDDGSTKGHQPERSNRPSSSTAAEVEAPERPAKRPHRRKFKKKKLQVSTQESTTNEVPRKDSTQSTGRKELTLSNKPSKGTESAGSHLGDEQKMSTGQKTSPKDGRKNKIKTSVARVIVVPQKPLKKQIEGNPTLDSRDAAAPHDRQIAETLGLGLSAWD